MYIYVCVYINSLFPMVITLAVLGGVMSMAPGPGGKGMGNIFGKMGKNVAKKIQKDKVTTRFSDVAGCNEAKKEIMVRKTLSMLSIALF